MSTPTAFPVSPVTGQSVTLTATVAAVSPGVGTPTGTVDFMDQTSSGSSSLGSEMLSNGVATISTTLIPSGDNSITAVYSGDTNFAGATSSALR